MKAWEWFAAATRQYAQQLMGPETTGQPVGFGPFDTKAEDGKYYHGSPDSPKTFRVISGPDESYGKGVIVTDWDPRTCTTDSAEVFCGNCELVERKGSRSLYLCKGHEVLGREGPVGGPGF